MTARKPPAAQALERIATGAHGIVTRVEALDAGVTRSELRRRLQSGILLCEHPGVYRLGHRAPSVEARYLAAVKACGTEALLADLAAAFLFGLIKGSAPPPSIVCPTERVVRGVRTRRCRRGVGPRGTTWRRIPVTTVPQTVIDLAWRLPEAELAAVWHEAEVRHDVRPTAVERILEARPQTPGVTKLRRVLYGETPVSLSFLESAFLALLVEAGLPLPQTNRVASGRRVDCRWPDLALTVELDSFRYHRSRQAWEKDRRREREAYARGDQFRRYTYGDVLEDPRQMLGELRSLLSSRPG